MDLKQSKVYTEQREISEMNKYTDLINRLRAKKTRDNRKLLDEAADVIEKLSSITMADALKTIENMERKGHWEICDVGWECSFCGRRITEFDLTDEPIYEEPEQDIYAIAGWRTVTPHYCKYCGANMRE